MPAQQCGHFTTQRRPIRGYSQTDRRIDFINPPQYAFQFGMYQWFSNSTGQSQDLSCAQRPLQFLERFDIDKSACVASGFNKYTPATEHAVQVAVVGKLYIEHLR